MHKVIEPFSRMTTGTFALRPSWSPEGQILFAPNSFSEVCRRSWCCSVSRPRFVACLQSVQRKGASCCRSCWYQGSGVLAIKSRMELTPASMHRGLTAPQEADQSHIYPQWSNILMHARRPRLCRTGLWCVHKAGSRTGLCMDPHHLSAGDCESTESTGAVLAFKQ